MQLIDRAKKSFYKDAALTQDIGDTEAFDAGKSTIIEFKNYFDKKQLIHQIHSQEADVLLTEQHSNL